MAEIVEKILIEVSASDQTIELRIQNEANGHGVEWVPDAEENGEAEYQIKEGCSYAYQITDGFGLRFQDSSVVTRSPFKENFNTGRIVPNIHVGTLTIDIVDRTESEVGKIRLEVQSVKASYREEYRFMLENIADKCTDLLLQHTALASIPLTIDFSASAATLYQRFSFIRSIIDSEEFRDSIHKILSAPVVRWKTEESERDIRNVKRMTATILRQFATSSNRMRLPDAHPLRRELDTIPAKVKVVNKAETVDTPENRFVKYAVESFRNLCRDFREKVKHDRLRDEARLLEDRLEQQLGHSVFREVQSLSSLPLNSPILQRKEGYREVLRVWLMMDLAARLIWKGGDDVYSAQRRDVAVLYEYWVFFRLLDLVKEVFSFTNSDTESLIEHTADGVGLRLKQGSHLAIRGVCAGRSMDFAVEFNYNRTFSGGRKYPKGGSWTKVMRPDYTLSIWSPARGETLTSEKTWKKSSELAEEREEIIHLHFDAKYKVENVTQLFGRDTRDEESESVELADLENSEAKGTFKRADLLKMHSYKDAIRRTAGAYVLYPGNDKEYGDSGFHELIPGLGAFAMKPSKTGEGSEALRKFFNDVREHFENRVSQRKKTSRAIFEIHQNRPSEALYRRTPPGVDPDETTVLVGYYQTKEEHEWIIKERQFPVGLYGNGLGPLGAKGIAAKYLLLRSMQYPSGRLYEITGDNPSLWSVETLLAGGFPTFESRTRSFMVFNLNPEMPSFAESLVWDLAQPPVTLNQENRPQVDTTSLTMVLLTAQDSCDNA